MNEDEERASTESVKMKVALTNSCVVRPEEPTWQGIMALTELDQIGVVTHVSTLVFYDEPRTDNLKLLFPLIVDSLKRVLVYFYPLAGRLCRSTGGRMELVCDGSGGAHMIEADCDGDMERFVEFRASPSEFKLLVPDVDYSTGIFEDLPLLSVQLTAFRCGGVSIGISASHAVGDGRSYSHFYSEWARLCRGETTVGNPPWLNRRILRAGEPAVAARSSFEYDVFHPPPLIIGETSDEKEKNKQTTLASLKISEEQIQALKAIANTFNSSTQFRPYSRYEVIAAHIWRCACRARRHADDQPTQLATCADIRNRVNPKLPATFFGNACVDLNVRSFSGEVTKNPLGFVANMIREVIESANDGYVNSVVDYLKSLGDLSPFQYWGPKFEGNPNVVVISLLGFSSYGLDFGWGKPMSVVPGPGSLENDGEMSILQGINGGDLTVLIRLQVDHIDDFKKHFYGDMNFSKL